MLGVLLCVSVCCYICSGSLTVLSTTAMCATVLSTGVYQSRIVSDMLISGASDYAC